VFEDFDEGNAYAQEVGYGKLTEGGRAADDCLNPWSTLVSPSVGCQPRSWHRPGEERVGQY
jgi:hypothetical protein